MGSFIEDFLGNMGPQVTEQLASTLGIGKETSAAIIPQVLPMILSGLKKQKDNYGGEPRVEHILNKYGSSSVLDDIAGLFSTKAKDPNPDPTLGGLLGNAGIEATNLFSKNHGVDSGIASKIIPMLAPVVLGYLTKTKDSGAGVSGIASLLDADGDGNILDDVAGFFGISGAAGDIVGGLLGGLFGGKK